MRCSSCESSLDRYVEGTLTPQRMRSMAAHLRVCASCSALLDELRIVDGLLETTRRAELPPNFTFAVMADARALPAPRERVHAVWPALAFYLIAAWVVITAGFSLFGARLSLVGNAAGAVRGTLAHSIGAIAGAAHAMGPVTPAVVGIVTGVLALDVMLIAAIAFFYSTIRPRLSARLARSEAS